MHYSLNLVLNLVLLVDKNVVALSSDDGACFIRVWSEQPIRISEEGTQLGKRRNWQNMNAGKHLY